VELYLPRSEILRQTRAHLGMQTDNDLGSQVEEQHVAAVQAAAMKVAQDCRWVNAQARVEIQIQNEQAVFSYPANCGPGGILAMSVYDQEQHWPIVPGIIPVVADVPVETAEGGGAFNRVQGRPRRFEQRNQVFLSPPADKPYALHVSFMRRMDLPTDESVSITDGQLIIYMAASMIARQMADNGQSEYFARLYVDRLAALRGWQAAGTTFLMDSNYDMSEDGLPVGVPNWDRSPLITGGMD
jgi:hypothetical protein